MIRRPLLVALARGVNLAFFLSTAIYCLLTSNTFTYEQFIKPHVSAALTGFAVWHGDLHWLVLSITALTIAPYLERSPARWIGWRVHSSACSLGHMVTVRNCWSS